MAGHARERAPGRWELRAFVGRDPLTGGKRYATRTIAASGRREADKLLAAFVADLDKGELTGATGSFGDLLDQWMALKARRWSPSTVKEHRGMVDRYLRALRPIEVARLRTHDLDVFYAGLAERGGRCTAKTRCAERPCRHGRPLEPATVRRVHVVVRAALQQAVKWGWIALQERERSPATQCLRGGLDVLWSSVPLPNGSANYADQCDQPANDELAAVVGACRCTLVMDRNEGLVLGVLAIYFVADTPELIVGTMEQVTFAETQRRAARTLGRAMSDG